MSDPSTWEADVVLSDGSIAHVRPVEPEDRQRFIDFYERVSDDSKYLRFFGAHPRLVDDDLDRWVNVDHYDRVTLVITEEEQIVATARYEVVGALLPARVADVSFLVQDDHHGRGAANILLEHLAHIGRECRIERFFAEMLPHNRQMVGVFVRAGYNVTPQLEDGFITVDFPIGPTARSREVMLQREQRAESRAISRLLQPRHVAVVGHIDDIRQVVHSLAAGGFRGKIHVLATASASGTEAAAAEDSPAELIDSLAGPIDLVIVVYDGNAHDDLLAASARKQGRGLVMLARGNNPGLGDEEIRRFVATARYHGLRALGPASLGVINTDPTVRLNGSPAPMPRPGAVGLFTQSAGVGTLALSRAMERHCGVSTFISAGAFSDITANDILHFWVDDERTRVCLLTLDAIGNPRKFFRGVRRLALEKPVVVFTPSRALASARHHALEGLCSAPASALDEVIRRSGAMVVQRRDAMFDIAAVLSRQPAPRGKRVMVLSNSMGLVTQMKQAASRFGLLPVDGVIGAGQPDTSETLLQGLDTATREGLDNPQIDAVVVAVVDVRGRDMQAAYERLASIARTTTDTPLIASFVGFDRPRIDYGGPEQPGDLPVFNNYADALEALAHIHDNAAQRASIRACAGADGTEDSAGASNPSRDESVAREIVDRILEESPAGRWATDEECAEILRCYGIEVVAWQHVTTVEEAIDAAERCGWDVVLKALSPVVRGRPELSAVTRHIADAATLRQAWDTLGRIAAELGVGGTGEDGESGSTGAESLMPVIQPTVPAGASLTMRAIEDPVLGPMISVGASGIASELLDDRAWRVPPLSSVEARGMLEQLAVAPILHGYSGTTPSRLDSIDRVLVNLAALKDDIAAVVDVELIPVVASAQDTHVVGARLRVAPLKEERDPLARGLPTGAAPASGGEAA